MAGTKNDVLVGKNADFSQASAPNSTSSESNGLVTDGKLWIGSGVLNVGGTHINAGSITSPMGTLIIGYSSPNITIDIDTAGPVLTQIVVQAGISPVTPTAGSITINGFLTVAGSTPVQTRGTATDTYRTEIQTSQAIASTDATKVGLAAFNNTQFTVDANGFVSSIGGGLTWLDVTGATQAVTASKGFLSNNAGTVTFTLPASSTIGDVFRIVGVQGAWVLAQNANQQVKIANTATTVGAGGSLASTNAGDCICLVATNTSASSVWRVDSMIGNITVV